MRLLKEATRKYLKIKNLKNPKEADLKYARKFERAYGKLNSFDKDFFFKVYLRDQVNKEWWRKYYTKSTYYRMRENVSKKFLDKLY